MSPMSVSDQYISPGKIGVFFLIAALFVVFSGFIFPSTEIYMYRTLLDGKPFFMYSSATWDFYDPIKEEGRLQPLAGMPQNIALVLMQAPTVSVVYLIQGILVFVLCLTMMLTFEKLGADRNLAFYAVILLVFSESVVFSFYHPVLTEGLLILFVVATVLFYLRFLDDPKKTSAAFLIVFSLLSCVSKISGAFILLVFGSAMIVSDLLARQKSRRRYLANALLVLVSLGWFAVSRMVAGNPVDQPVPGMLPFLLTWFTDAVVVLLVLPLGILFPILGILRGREYDFKSQVCACLCFAAACYTVLLVWYGKHSEYHLAPVYFLYSFAFPLVAGWLRK